MKKGRLIYLVLLIVLFALLRTPYFENVTTGSTVTFFGSARNFVSLYPWLIFLGMVEGCLVLLYIYSIIKDNKIQEPKKFDLS